MPGGQEQAQQRRWVGEQLALYAKSWSTDPSGSKKLEALVADLAPNDPDLRSALKVAMSRDGFQKLLNISRSQLPPVGGGSLVFKPLTV